MRRPRGQTPRRRAATRRAIDRVRDRGDIVARAGVDVPELRADDRRPVAVRQRRGQQLDAHSPLLVGRNGLDLRAADAEVAQGAIDGDVALLADDDADARRALSPSRARSHPMRRTWCRAAAKAVMCAIWQPVTKPTETPRAAGAAHSATRARPPRPRRHAGRPEQAGVLVPGRREPVRRQAAGRRRR